MNEWQIHQYRAAIAENKWYMSERTGHPVSWKEAEKDFLHNQFYGCAPKWRAEFCAVHCSCSDTCNLSKNFCEQQNAPFA